IDFVFLVIGGIVMIRNKTGKSEKVIFLWLLAAPIASALTFQAPSALRAENMVVPLVIISAFGATQIILYFYRFRVLRKFVYFTLGLFLIWGCVRYLHMYYTHMAKEYPYSSQYSVKEMVSYVQENENKYKK